MLLSILFILPSVEYLILSIPKIEKDWSARRKKTHSSKSQASKRITTQEKCTFS